MSVRDDTSRHLGEHPQRNRRTKTIIVTLVILAAIAFGLYKRKQAFGWYALKEVRATWDEGYVYLLLQTEGSGAPDWNTLLYRIAVDTHDPKRGERMLPEPYSASIATGAEFLIEIGGPGASAIKVTPSYDPYPDHGQAVEGRPIVSPEKPSGTFQEMAFQANRERFWRNGQRVLPVVIERGKLRFVRDHADARTDLRYDIAVGEGVIEIRIPWSLLNVSDPSSRLVLNGISRSENSEASATDGFRFYVYSFNRAAKRKPLQDQLPGRWRTAPLFAWKGWDEPKYKLELKESAQDIARMMKELSDVPKP
jgi:hypothetical protein